MRRLLQVSTALCLSVAAMACSGSSKKDQPGQVAESASGPAWTLTLKSTCLNAAQDQCVGKYGFSVTADGNWQVGPGPKGQIMTGALTADEMTALNTQVQPALAGTASSHTESVESGVPNYVDDTHTLVRQNKEAVIAHNQGGEFYYVTTAAEDALSLHNAMSGLAKSYYRMPFGNDCADAVAKVEELYAPAQACENDLDCVYVDAVREYRVVEPRSPQWIYTENCQAVKPMLVAGTNHIRGAVPLILSAYAAARSVCGQEFDRHVVNGQYACRDQQAGTSTPPVCVQNRCQSRL